MQTADQKSQDHANSPSSNDQTLMSLDHLNSLLAEDPKNIDLLLQRTQRYIEASSFVKAISDAHTIHKIDPQCVDAYLIRGYCYEQITKFDLAMKAYVTALEIDPQHPIALQRRNELIEFVVDMRIPIKSVSFPLTPEQEQYYYQYPLSDQNSTTPSSSNSVNSDASQSADDFDALIAWMRANGASFPKLHLKVYGQNNRGVHALLPVSPGEHLLFVPHSLIITTEVARASAIGAAITRAELELRSRHTYLASFILEERRKGSASPWYPYLKILPTEFSNVPLFYYDCEIQELVGTICVQKIYHRLLSIYEEFAQLQHHVPEYFSRYTLYDFLWARICIISRIFGLLIGELKTDGLIPYADMLNHKLPHETHWTFHTPADGFFITAHKSLPRGAPVHESYGRKCNNRFLINYGFALPENDANESVLRFEISPDDPCYRVKMDLMRGASVLDAIRLLSVSIDTPGGKYGSEEEKVINLGPLPPTSLDGQEQHTSPRREYQVPGDIKERKTLEMLSFLRFVSMTPYELHGYLNTFINNYNSSKPGKKAHGNGSTMISADSTFSADPSTHPSLDVHQIPFISSSNELKAVELLLDSCNRSLKRFPTTLQHDEQMLEKYSQEPYSLQDLIILDPEDSPYALSHEERVNSDLSCHQLRRENYINCLLMRMGEKRVLTNLLSYASGVREQYLKGGSTKEPHE